MKKIMRKTIMPSFEMEVLFDLYNESLENMLPEGQPIVTSSNGYQRASYGPTVVFFKQLQSGLYHIVVCETTRDKMKKAGITYDDLCRTDIDLIF